MKRLDAAKLPANCFVNRRDRRMCDSFRTRLTRPLAGDNAEWRRMARANPRMVGLCLLLARAEGSPPEAERDRRQWRHACDADGRTRSCAQESARSRESTQRRQMGTSRPSSPRSRESNSGSKPLIFVQPDASDLPAQGIEKAPGVSRGSPGYSRPFTAAGSSRALPDAEAYLGVAGCARPWCRRRVYLAPRTHPR